MKKKRENSDHRLFGTMAPGRLFLRCALPSMISMAVTSLYTVADGIFVGQFIGADALAAVNLVMPFIMMSFALADMIAVGSSVQIAVRLGEGRTEEGSRIFTNSCLLIQAVSILTGLGGLFLARPLLGLLDAEPAVIGLAADYMEIFCLSAPFVMIFFAVDNYLRICGKVGYSMWMNIIMSVGNIVLDWLFICRFGWGIWSAALATCLSLAVGTALGFWPFFRKKLVLRFVRGRIRGRLLMHMIYNGSSEFFSNISSSVCMVLMNGVLLRQGGSSAVAAFSIVMYVDSIVKGMLYGMSDSIQPAVSYNYGNRRKDRIVALERAACLTGFCLSGLVMLLMFSQGDLLSGLFLGQGDRAIQELSERAMSLFSFSYLVSWSGILFSSFFTAVNCPGHSLLLSTGHSLLFPAAGLLVLPPLLGLDGVWLTPLFSGILTALTAGVLFFRWMKKEHTGQKQGERLCTGEREPDAPKPQEGREQEDNGDDQGASARD